MQTIQVIETIKWLSSVVPKEFLDLLSAHVEQKSKNAQENTATIIGATHRFSEVRPTILEHPFAPAVLAAFGLATFLHEGFATQAATDILLTAHSDPSSQLRDLWGMGWRWREMVRLVEPIEKLTIPPVVSKESDFDEVLTLEILTEKKTPSLDTVQLLLSASEKLYSSIAAAKKLDAEPLRVVYITSGSGFRFDLKGLGEPIKRLKELLVVVWEKIRHRKEDDFVRKAKAAMEGIDLLNQIGASKHLDHETKARLTHDIAESTHGLFRTGALPREIKTVEVVSNVLLLEDFQKKLLPAPPEKAQAKPAATRRKTKIGETKPSEDHHQ